jgi:hypothetical protein
MAVCNTDGHPGFHANVFEERRSGLLEFRAVAADLDSIDFLGGLTAVPDNEAFPADELIRSLGDNLHHKLIEHDRARKLGAVGKVRFLQFGMDTFRRGRIHFLNGFQGALGSFGYIRACFVVILCHGYSSRLFNTFPKL